ncbi:MAG: hypothetical protein NC177_06105 [Ruminococcus flavefaciens]|nr:hypothetical protein [Ruminococcus flavefaciens]
MEKLFICGIFADLNPTAEKLYQKKLDSLFLENPDDNTLLELELLSGNISESIIYITNHADFRKINNKLYKKYLAEYLEKLYHKMDIKTFSGLCYKIWLRLPENVAEDEYFITLNYADDYVSIGFEKQAVKSFENLFSHYESI